MFSSLRRPLVAFTALAAIGMTASSASAASAYVTDAKYDTWKSGTAAQRAAIDLTKVTYWTDSTRFYVKWQVRDLTAIGGKGYNWRGELPNTTDQIWVSTDDGYGVSVSRGSYGYYGSDLCASASKTRTASVAYNYVKVSVPKSCFPKGIRVTSPFGRAVIFNSRGTTITADRTATGTGITPNP